MGLGEEVEEMGSVLYHQRLGGGQGCRDRQWETVLQLVANLIMPESLLRPLVITPPPATISKSHLSPPFYIEFGADIPKGTTRQVKIH